MCCGVHALPNISLPNVLCVCVCVGEACWWTIHPASKQRSEGEKVRVGDDLILVSVSSERYLVSHWKRLCGCQWLVISLTFISLSLNPSFFSFCRSSTYHTAVAVCTWMPPSSRHCGVWHQSARAARSLRVRERERKKNGKEGCRYHDRIILRPHPSQILLTHRNTHTLPIIVSLYLLSALQAS